MGVFTDKIINAFAREPLNNLANVDLLGVKVVSLNLEGISNADFLNQLKGTLETVRKKSEEGYIDILPRNLAISIVTRIENIEGHIAKLLVQPQEGIEAVYKALFAETNALVLNLFTAYINDWEDEVNKLIANKRLYGEVKGRLVAINETFEQAKKRAQEIFDFAENAKVSSAESNRIAEEISKLYNSTGELSKAGETEYQKLVQLLTTATESTNIKIVELQGLVATCNELKAQIENANNASIESSTKILEKQAKVDELIKAITAQKNDITNTVNEARNQSTEYSRLIGTIQATLNQLTEILGKANEPETGAQALFTKITDTKAKVDELFSKIEVNYGASTKLNASIGEIENKSKKSGENISSIEANATELLNKLKTTHAIATQAVSSNEFAETRNSLKLDYEYHQKKVRDYIFGLLICVLIILIVIIVKYAINQGNAINNQFWCILLFLKLGFALPLIYLIGFHTKEYNKGKAMFQKYQYRTVLSMVIGAKVDELHRNFNESGDREIIRQFTIENLSRLYSEPYYDEKMQVDDKIKLNNSKLFRLPEFPEVRVASPVEEGK